MDAPRIVVYTMTGCPHCSGVKDYLRQRGVEFTERNVLEDDDAMADFRELGFRGTPVTVIGDEAILGFDSEKLAAALESAAGA